MLQYALTIQYIMMSESITAVDSYHVIKTLICYTAFPRSTFIVMKCYRILLRADKWVTMYWCRLNNHESLLINTKFRILNFRMNK